MLQPEELTKDELLTWSPGRGTEQIAAGYVMYGPATTLVYTVGRGTHGFTLAPETGEESVLAEKRTAMMQIDKVAEDLRDAHEAVAGDRSPTASTRTPATPSRCASCKARRRGSPSDSSRTPIFSRFMVTPPC